MTTKKKAEKVEKAEGAQEAEKAVEAAGEKAEEAVEAAGEAAGACGVTISGAGSSLLALSTPSDASGVARAMAEALSAAGNPATPLHPAIALTGLSVPDASRFPLPGA